MGLYTLDNEHTTETQNVGVNCNHFSDSDNNEADDIEIFMNAPLSSVAIINSIGNALESLQKFVAAIMFTLGEELNVQINRKKDILTQVV